MKIYYLSFIMLTLVLGGCADTQYLDRPTPPGNPIPPPVRATKPVVKEVTREDPRVASLRSSAAAPQQRTTDGSLAELGGTKSTKYVKPGTGCFQTAYKEKGHPRIAIFLNRRLSPEVRQWATKKKIVTAGDGELAVGKVDFFQGQAGAASGEGNQSLYEQRYVEDEGGTLLNEKDLWRIENGFMQPFLDNRVQLVDRTTIMRLVAAAHPDAENSNKLVSPKLVEMKSLGQYADIFTELVIEKSSEVPVGVALKAVAKDVSDGRILANVNSLNWDWDAIQEKGEKVVATATGYEFKETKKTVSLDYIADRLAKELMVDLCNIWK